MNSSLAAYSCMTWPQCAGTEHPWSKVLLSCTAGNGSIKRCSLSLIIREMPNPNHKEIPPHNSEWPSSKRTQIANVDVDAEKREQLGTVAGSVNWGSCCGHQYGGVSKNEKHDGHITQHFPFWVYRLKNNQNKKTQNEKTNTKWCTHLSVHSSISYKRRETGTT